jgi:hypothetical protein
MQRTLKDYGYTLNHAPLLYDNESAIKIGYNSCEYSRTKHIDIRHHFLRDHVIKRDIVISHMRTNEQLTDIFTKPFDKRRFWELRIELNIINFRNVVWLIVHIFVFWKWFETKLLMLSLWNSWIFLINGSSSTYHGKVYVITVCRPCPIYIYIHLYIYLVLIQSVKTSNFRIFQVGSPVLDRKF